MSQKQLIFSWSYKHFFHKRKKAGIFSCKGTSQLVAQLTASNKVSEFKNFTSQRLKKAMKMVVRPIRLVYELCNIFFVVSLDFTYTSMLTRCTVIKYQLSR